MKTNKNIDRLFQEKLKDFEVIPPDNVWGSIETNLKQKKGNRTFPLWLRIGSAAAIMLLLSIGGINYFDDKPKINDISDINTNKDVLPTLNKNGIDKAVFDETENNSLITDATKNEDVISETLKVDSHQTEKQIKFNSNTENSQISDLNSKNGGNLSNSKNDEEKLNNISLSSSSSVADNGKNKSNIQTTSSKGIYGDKLLNINKKEENHDSQIANELTNSNTFLNNPSNNVLNQNSENNIANNKTQSNIKVNESANSNKILNSSNIGLNSDTESSVANNTKTENTFSNAIASNKNETIQSKKDNFGEKISLDSIQKSILSSEEEVALIPNNYDDFLIDSKEKEEDTKKWSVASTFAPIYYNSFSTKGSPLDSQFEDSPKTGSKSVAYGVKVGYKLNDKLTLQSGVSKIDVGYKIGNVFINPSQQLEGRLTNVNYVNTANIINVNSQNFFNDSQIETTSVFPIKGELNQSFGYIEVPLELKYSLTNNTKKLGVNLIGGFSTLLLNKNEVFVTTSEFSSNLGEANNLNKVNFSGNIGFDVDYKISKKIYINVAPMLKIHTSTFSKNDKNFQPYLFGVYTGLNYRF